MARKSKTPPPAPSEKPGPGPDPEQARPSMEPANDEKYVIEPDKMTISEYLKLPEAEQDRIWQQLGPTLAETMELGTDWPELRNKLFNLTCLQTSQTIENTLKTLASPPKELTAAFDNISKTTATAGKTIQKAAEKLLRPASSIVQDWQPIITQALERAEEIAKMTMQLREFLDSPEAQKMIVRWNVLKPYYHALKEEKPRADGIPLQEYERAIMREAEARARADGKWPGTEILELNLQRFSESIKESPSEQTPEQVEESGQNTLELSQTLGKIESYYLSTAKLARSLLDITSGEIEAGAVNAVGVFNVNKPDEVTTSYVITMDKDKVRNLSGKPYTHYDRTVMRALCSIWEAASAKHKRAVFTARDIFRLMKGNAADDNPSPQCLFSITESLQKMLTMKFEIDASDEVDLRKVKDPHGQPMNGFYRKRQLIYYDEIELKSITGQTYPGYELRDIPLLWQYSKLTGQFSAVPAAMLSITDDNGSQIAITENRMALLDYLLERYVVMSRDEKEAQRKYSNYKKARKKDPSKEEKPLGKFRKQSRTILFETMFENTGIDTQKASRSTLKYSKDYVLNVLASWRMQGFIRDFKEQKKGRTLTGVTLVL